VNTSCGSGFLLSVILLAVGLGSAYLVFFTPKTQAAQQAKEKSALNSISLFACIFTFFPGCLIFVAGIFKILSGRCG